MQAKLRKIDHNLIKLLGERISILSKLKPLSVQEQLSDVTSLLAKFGVPDSVWENIVISCVATLNTVCTSPDSLKPRRVTVVGGRGAMGQFFTQQLFVAGHDVSILEKDDWNYASSLLAEAELVLVCVPTEFTLDVIRNLSKYLAPTTALADITSIKTPIVQVMLEHHAGPVMGLHPMFGPGVKSFLSQKIVVCPGREYNAFQWLLDLVESKGGKLIVCTPEDHDQIMIAIQAIRHFCTFSLGVFMAEAGIDIGLSLEFSSPIYRLEIDIVSRLFAQDPSLYVDILLASEERRKTIGRLTSTYSRLADMVAQKDKAALIQEFEGTQSVFREEAARALKESNYVINALSTFLAATEVEQRSVCHSAEDSVSET
ncbi:bifunctional chorismate mutase/prephenate dehydrogenase [Nostoc commune]|uniref:bifunctional chorismate mutase/prephenate dehydrogenase n=1 Tax=Nostoc commune TaxID=1178 RepID=UPI0018C4E945|nr:bifunctional chorismate mutase/prephenate dehydrogenase [Nostoc commune]MBG1264585.1 bifunctional chorismate mutase/prephenate dehydrogenase [Nostoc commune BAE]